MSENTEVKAEDTSKVVESEAKVTDEKDALDEKLGAGGLKALREERAAKSALAKENTALAAKLKEFEDAKLSDADRQAQKLADLQKDADSARGEALRYRIAAKYQLTGDDAELFLTGSDEETLIKQAERLAERAKEAKPRAGVHVKSEGHAPDSASSLDTMIADAQKARNFTRVIALKEQRAQEMRSK